MQRHQRLRKHACALLALASALATSLDVERASAASLEVGPGKSYATPCAAIAAAKPNDEIVVSAGTYTDSCTIAVAGLKLRGIGGQPKVDLSGSDHPAQYKGIYVVTADDVTIENLELTGAHISSDNGENAAAIRVEGKGLTVRGCKIHDNQNGILGGTMGTLTIEHTELFHNGLGDGCNSDGCTHNVYVANIDTLNFRFNWSHGIATDTADKGHLLKSRAKTNFILYNRVTGEAGFDSYEINLPNGGLAVVVGNLIQKGKSAGNSTLLSWGEEGTTNPDKRLFLVNNTFVNDYGSGTFVRAQGATLTAKNNLFVGAGTLASTGPLSADNLSVTEPGFVDRAAFDYHLTASSPALGKAVAAGAADQFSLTAVSEYVHPLGDSARASVRDVGAYEYSSPAQATRDAGTANSDAGSATKDAGAATKDAGSEEPDPDAGADEPNADDDDDEDASDAMPARGSHDSGCSLAASQPGSCGLFCLLLICFLLGSRRLGRSGFWIASCLTLGCSAAPESAQRDDAGNEDVGQATEPEDSGEELPSALDASGAGARDASTQTAVDAGSKPPPDATTQGSSSAGGGALCPDLGWCELKNTKLAAVCPAPAQYTAIQANEGCSGVINDWSGGMADEKRNRLVLWGGGHRGYFGNEVYALDLNKVSMQRLNDPSDIAGVDLTQCSSPEAYADGRPSSRHTYDGLAYLPEADKMLALAGSGIPCGYAVQGTWLLDLAAVDSTSTGSAAPWRQLKPASSPSKAAYGVAMDYDSNSKRVIVNDTYNLAAYDLADNAYALLNDSIQTGAHIDYHMTGRVDPKRKLFILVGGKGSADGGMQVFDIASGSDHAQQDWTGLVSGCEGLIAATSPGWAYDPQQDKMIGWAGGDTVYTFDVDSKRCTTATHGGGPGPQNENGTFGRFRYFPSLKLFAVVNAYDRNAYTLRLSK